MGKKSKTQNAEKDEEVYIVWGVNLGRTILRCWVCITHCYLVDRTLSLSLATPVQKTHTHIHTRTNKRKHTNANTQTHAHTDTETTANPQKIHLCIGR